MARIRYDKNGRPIWELEENEKKFAPIRETISLDDLGPVRKTVSLDDLGPVRQTVKTTSEAPIKNIIAPFKDGYKAGDIAKTILKGGISVLSEYNKDKRIDVEPIDTGKLKNINDYNAEISNLEKEKEAIIKDTYINGLGRVVMKPFIKMQELNTGKTITSDREDQIKAIEYKIGQLKMMRDEAEYEEEVSKLNNRQIKAVYDIANGVKNAKETALKSGLSEEKLDNLVDIFKRKQNLEDTEGLEKTFYEWGKNHPNISIATEAGANLLGGTTGTIDTITQKVLGTGERGIDTNSWGFRLSHGSNAANTGAKEVSNWNIGGGIDGLDILHDAGVSILENSVRVGIANAIGSTALGLEGKKLADFSAKAGGAMMYPSVFTQSLIENKEKGYSDGKAISLGLISAGVEAYTEAHSLETILNPENAKNFLTKVGKSMLAEGSEEVTSELINTAVDNIANGDFSDYNMLIKKYVSDGMSQEEAVKKALCDKGGDLLTSFITGALAGGVMGGGAHIIQGGNKLSETEKKVVDAETDNRIKEEEQSGNKLSDKEKKNIRKDVITDLEKGRISTDTIESVLGGETYNKYKNSVDGRENLKKELAELRQMKSGEMNDIQKDRLAELKAMNLNDTSESDNLKSQLENEVYALAKESSRLNESYNEKSRRRQNYEADISKYDKAQQETIKNAVESGVLNNTNRTHEFVDMIAKVSAEKGVLFDFTDNEKLKASGFALEGKGINGYVSDNKVTVNIHSAKAINAVVGHEITHILEGTEHYAALQEAVKQYAQTKGEYDARLQSIAKMYENVEGANVDNELTADLIGDYLFTDDKFIESLSSEQPSLFKKIFNEIKYLCKVATAGSKEARELEKLKKKFKDIYGENTSSEGENSTKYSVSNVANADEILYNKDNPLSVTNRAKTDNKSSIKWVYDAKIFSVVENKLFHEKISEINQGSNAFSKAANGEYMIPIENKIVFTDGNYDSPQISEIIEVMTDKEDEFQAIKERIFNVEKGKLDKSDAVQVIESVYGNGSILSYGSGNSEVYGWEDGRRKGKTRRTAIRNYINKQIRTGNAGKSQETQVATNVAAFSNAQNTNNSLSEDGEDIKFSLSDDIAPVKKYGNYNVYGKDIALEKSSQNDDIAPIGENVKRTVENSFTSTDEDIAPVRKDIQTPSNDIAPIRNDIKQNDDLGPVRDDIVVQAKEDKIKYEISDSQAEQEKNVEDDKKQETRSKRKVLHSNIINSFKDAFSQKNMDLDTVLINGKRLNNFRINDNTPQRVMDKTFGYKAGELLADLTVNTVAQNETEGIKWLNTVTGKNGLLRALSQEYHIKPNSKESAAAQMYLEGFYVNEIDEYVKYGDAELAKDFPDAEVRKNIRGLATDIRIRDFYDTSLNAINAARTRNAYDAIERLDNYALHFRAMDDTFSKIGIPFNPNDIRAKDLPTDLNGVTADLKPGKPYFSSEKHRTGVKTSYDLLGGIERYATSAKNQIYHIDDIQKLRALRNYIADMFGQAKGLEGLDELTNEEAKERIEQVYNGHLSNFARFLNEEANVLAGKTSLIDRGIEGLFGRRGLQFLNTVNKQVGSNMVGLNLSSPLTNFLPVVQTVAKCKKQDCIKSFSQLVLNKIKNIKGHGDGFTDKCSVILRRKDADRFYQTPFQKIANIGYIPMSVVDNIATEFIARTKYNELTRKGMNEQQAYFETDKWVSRLMGDRSLGQQPLMYNSKVLGLLTKFQLEVRNQLDSQFYDTYQEAKLSNEEVENKLLRNAKTAAKVTSTIFQLAVAQHIFGTVFEKVAGYNPAFDIISVILTALGYDDEDDSEDTLTDNLEQAMFELVEDLPYSSLITNGGRIPISSALPIKEIFSGVDKYGNEKSRLETLGEIAPYYILPTGYGQIKKTVNGLKMFDDDLPVSGSYTDSGDLRYPVEKTPWNVTQAALFGQYANKNAREYFDNDIAPIKKDDIELYKELGLSIDEYREIQKELKKASDLTDKNGYMKYSDEAGNVYWYDKDTLTVYDEDYNEADVSIRDLNKVESIAEQLDYIDSLPLSNEQKNLLYNDIDPVEKTDKYGYKKYTGIRVNEDGELEEGNYYYDSKRDVYYNSDYEQVSRSSIYNLAPVKDRDMSNYSKFSDYEAFDFYNKNPEKYKFLKNNGISYEEYTSSKENKEAYDWAYEAPERIAVAKVLDGDIVKLKSYTDEMDDFKADKDSNGKSITGSKKKKILNYVNALNEDYYAKLILFKMKYPADDTYNYEIIDYLNEREDVSYSEMETILKELGFKVDSNGNITW